MRHFMMHLFVERASTPSPGTPGLGRSAYLATVLCNTRKSQRRSDGPVLAAPSNPEHNDAQADLGTDFMLKRAAKSRRFVLLLNPVRLRTRTCRGVRTAGPHHWHIEAAVWCAATPRIGPVFLLLGTPENPLALVGRLTRQGQAAIAIATGAKSSFALGSLCPIRWDNCRHASIIYPPCRSCVSPIKKARKRRRYPPWGPKPLPDRVRTSQA